jgi:hypothetical protein
VQQRPPTQIDPLKIADHVEPRHTFDGPPEYATRSKFVNGSEVPDLIRLGDEVPAFKDGNSWIRVYDVGRLIGVDQATGRGTSIMTVVTDLTGRLRTAYPGVPKGF